MNLITFFGQVLSRGIADQCTVVSANITLTFKDYIGAVSSCGAFSVDDIVPLGVFIWGDENFIGTPDCVFSDENGVAVGFYQYEIASAPDLFEAAVKACLYMERMSTWDKGQLPRS